jgi:hypothetical protein
MNESRRDDPITTVPKSSVSWSTILSDIGMTSPAPTDEKINSENKAISGVSIRNLKE